MYKKMLNIFFYPLINQLFALQNQIDQYHKFLFKTQYLDEKELEKLQKKKLKLILEYSYTNVPYYNSIFKKLNLKPDDFRVISDLEKLPILTKEDVVNNFNELIPRNISNYQLIPSFTGGTTGKRMTFYVDNHWEACNMAAAYREWGWAGYELGDKMTYLWGSLNDVNVQSQIKLKLFNMIQRIQILNAYNLNEQTLQSYFKILKNFNPKFINSYSSAAYIMSSFLDKQQISSINPNAILTSCETLHDFQRKMIERSFQCDVYDYYSARDTSLHAAECSEHMGYHTSIENALVEFTKDGGPVSYGEYGDLVITDFSNFAMPFIRYKIGDVGIPTDEKCNCGRTLPLIKKILGRITDMVITEDGKYIPGLFFIHIFDTDAIKKYQLIQKRKDFFVLKIVKGKSYSSESVDGILRKIRNQCGDVRIRIEEVNDIPLTTSGKYQFVISEIAQKLR